MIVTVMLMIQVTRGAEIQPVMTLASGIDSDCDDCSSGTCNSGVNDGDHVKRQAGWHCSQTGAVAEPEECCLDLVGNSAMF